MKILEMTKVELRQKTGISASNLDAYLKQKTHPGLKAIAAIAEALDTSPARLISDPSDFSNLAESYLRVRDDLRALAHAEGISWPPPVDYLAKILK